MKSVIVNLECISNLHVGNGDVNYNIIDNEVERDPVTNYPTINASGVKGALRVFLKDDVNCVNWFGSANGSGDKKPGELKVLAANVLAMPLRASKGNVAYYLVSTKEMRDEYEELVKTFSIAADPIAQKDAQSDAEAEGVKLGASFTVADKTIYDMKEEDFMKTNLPVIARNHLENGISQNLWYEEVVPHKTLMYFIVTSNNDALVDAFKTAVDGKIIQFGGNASIGYGLCKVTVK